MCIIVLVPDRLLAHIVTRWNIKKQKSLLQHMIHDKNCIITTQVAPGYILLESSQWLSKMKHEVFFLHGTAGRRVGRRLVTRTQHSSIFIIESCNMRRCSHGGSILWMYWQDVTLVDTVAPNTSMNIWLGGVWLCKKRAFSLSIINLQFFQKTNSTKSLTLLPKFSHQILT
jgi:hypothetical protein